MSRCLLAAMIAGLLLFAGPLIADDLNYPENSQQNEDLWLQTSLNNVAVNDLAFDRDGVLFAATVANGVWRSFDRGDTWQKADSGLANQSILSLLTTESGRLYAGTSGSGLFVSEDAGDYWEVAGTGLDHPAIQTLHIDEASGLLLAGTVSGGIYISSDDGQTWQASQGVITANASIYDFTNVGNLLYVAVDGEGVFVSDDEGQSWNTIGLDSIDIRTLDHTAEDGLLAGAWYDGVFLFDGNNSTWGQVGLPNIHVMDIARASNGQLYAATHGRGVHSSENNGLGWTEYNDATLSIGVWSLAIDGDDFVYAGTSGSGVYRTLTSVVTDISVPEQSITTFSLLQNYPNPFNPQTTIRFSLEVQGSVELDVIDPLGRVVATLVNEPMMAGEHRVEFRSDNRMSSGLYFYRLTVDGRSAVRRMLLVR